MNAGVMSKARYTQELQAESRQADQGRTSACPGSAQPLQSRHHGHMTLYQFQYRSRRPGGQV